MRPPVPAPGSQDDVVLLGLASPLRGVQELAHPGLLGPAQEVDERAFPTPVDEGLAPDVDEGQDVVGRAAESHKQLKDQDMGQKSRCPGPRSLLARGLQGAGFTGVWLGCGCERRLRVGGRAGSKQRRPRGAAEKSVAKNRSRGGCRKGGNCLRECCRLPRVPCLRTRGSGKRHHQCVSRYG